MRVVHIAAYGGPYPGSFVAMMRGIMREAGARRWQRELVFHPVARERPWLAELERDGIPYRFVPLGSQSQTARWIEALVAEQRGPTVLHTHFGMYDLATARAARQRPDSRVIWHAHSPIRKRHLVPVRTILMFAIGSRRVARILCVSEELVEQVTGLGARAAKVTYFRNAIDVERFEPIAPEERKAARATLRLLDEDAVLVHFGWDWLTKGGDVFLQAAGLLRTRDPRVVAVTIGAGAEAWKLREQLDLGDAVRILDPVDDVRMLYAAADVFVAPSRAEGAGVHTFSVMEALSSGIPAVVTDLSGHLALAEQVPTCHIVKLDPEEIASEVASLLGTQQEDKVRLAFEAHAAMRAAFDLRSWCRELADLYEQLLGAPS